LPGTGARPSYAARPVPFDFRPGHPSAPWGDLAPLKIDRYLWLDNGYRPDAEARLGWSEGFLYVRFRVGEARIRVRHMSFQDPVYKDSCVELFIDAFPEKRIGYLNLETNAAGTLLAAFGPDRTRRRPLRREELAGFEAAATVPGPVDGEHGAEAWTLGYRVPLSLFERLYGERIRTGHRCRGNLYTCGDETETPHYGAWSPVTTPGPDFHRPEFFGEIVFV